VRRVTFSIAIPPARRILQPGVNVTVSEFAAGMTLAQRGAKAARRESSTCR
jgi:hypothetical protein